MKLGVSTACLYPTETETAMKILMEQGILDFEMFVNCESEIKPPFQKKIKALLAQTGSRLHSIHPFSSVYEPYLLFSAYERRYRDGLELYKRYCDMASNCGASLIVIHGDRKERTVLPDEGYFERFHGLMEVGEALGVTVAQENVYAYRADNAEFIAKMKNALPKARFVYDIKQEYRTGVPFLTVAEAMGDRIIHTHISDNTKEQECRLPLTGEVDFARLFSFLKASGFDGAAIIEVYRHNFGEIHEIKQSYQSLLQSNSDI